MNRIGPYELLERLGSGAEGQVWRARADDGGLLALKLGPAGASASAFHAEALAMARLDHPAIVDVWDLGHDGGRPWLAMELALGPMGLNDVQSWGELRGVVLRLLDGLACAHAQGRIHRDIKPANLLRYEDGVRIADFGLSTTSRVAGPDLHAASGTPRYMPPEQIHGHAHAFGPWTDLYALGATAWEWTTGQPLFPGADMQQVLRAHLAQQAPTLRPRFDVAAGLAGWFEGMLAKRPHGRFPSAVAARSALAALGPAVPASAHPLALSSYDEGAASTLYLEPFAGTPTEAQADATPPDHTVEPPERLPPELPTLRPRRPSTAHRFREIPPIGREREQAALWSAVRGPGFRVVAITGPPGTGSSSLGRWVAAQLHRYGGRRLLLGQAGTSGDDGLRGVLRAVFGGQAADDETIDARTREQLSQTGIRDPWVVRTMVACQQVGAAPLPAAQRAVAFADGLARREGTVVFLDEAAADDATWADLRSLRSAAEGRDLTVVVAGHGLSAQAEGFGDPLVTCELEPLEPEFLAAIARGMGVLDPDQQAALTSAFDGRPADLVRWIREARPASDASIDIDQAAWLWAGWVHEADTLEAWGRHAVFHGLDGPSMVSWAQRTGRLALTGTGARLLPRALREAFGALPADRRAVPRPAGRLTARVALALGDDDALADRLEDLLRDHRPDVVLALLALRGDELPATLRAYRGRALHLTGRTAEAYEVLSAAVDELPVTHPSWAQTFERLGSTAFNTGKVGPYLTRGLAVLPEVPAPGSILLRARLASLCASTGRGDEARRLLDGFPYGEDPRADLLAARMTAIQAQRRGDMEEAVASFEIAIACAEAIGQTNHHAMLLAMLAYAEDALGRRDDADARYEAAWASAAHDADLCTAANLATVQGANWLDHGRYDEARHLLVRAARRFQQLHNSEEGIARMNLAMLELAVGHDHEARAQADRAVAVFADAGRDAFAQTARGLRLAAAADTDVADLRTALEAGPAPILDRSILEVLETALAEAEAKGHDARRDGLQWWLDRLGDARG